MTKCYVQIAGGIGNVIQSVPFIKECHEHFDEVYGVYTRQGFTPDLFTAIAPMIVNLFTNNTIYDMHVPPDGIYFGSPTESPARDKFKQWDEPEYTKWFTVHNIAKPDIYDIQLNLGDSIQKSHDIIIWAGCKPIWKSKRWPYWDKLCNMYEDIAIVGLPGEGDNIPDHVIDYRGTISLQDTASLISMANFYVGNEGGTSHLAAAVGTRTYIIYGASDNVKNFPPERKGLYRIALNLPCQPCQFTPDRGFSAGDGCPDLSCLKYLTANIVKSYIDKSQESYSKI